MHSYTYSPGTLSIWQSYKRRSQILVPYAKPDTNPNPNPTNPTNPTTKSVFNMVQEFGTAIYRIADYIPYRTTTISTGEYCDAGDA